GRQVVPLPALSAPKRTATGCRVTKFGFLLSTHAPAPALYPPSLHHALPISFRWQPLLWPIDPMDGPHEIAGTMGEARGGESGERFHAGIDVHADEGTSVRAVRDGFVAAPIAVADFGTLNESVRIGAVTYVHLRVGRDRHGRALDDPRFVATRDDRGAIVGMRVKRGARFTTADVIGTVNAFNHVHLN